MRDIHYCFDCDETIASVGILKMYMEYYPPGSDAYKKMIGVLANENTGVMRPGLGKFLRKLVRQNGGRVTAGIFTRNQNTALVHMIACVMHAMAPGLHVAYILQIDHKMEKKWDLLAHTYKNSVGKELDPRRCYYYDDTMYTSIQHVIGKRYIHVEKYVMPIRKEYIIGFYERYVEPLIYGDGEDNGSDGIENTFMNYIKGNRKPYAIEEDACKSWPLGRMYNTAKISALFSP